MKILVTGSNGFIGNKLIKSLLNAGHSVLGLDISLPVAANLIESPLYTFIQLDLNTASIPDLKAHQIDLVVHLAIAMRPTRQQSSEELLIGTHRLLHAVQVAQTPYVIGMSSLSVLDFDKAESGSMIDESTVRCDCFDKMGRYAALKSKQERVFLDFSDENPVTKMVIIRPGLVYQKPDINDAYAGIIKKKAALIALNNGHIPLVELDSLLNAMVSVVSHLHHLSTNTALHIIDDGLPNQSEYLSQLKKLPRLTVKVNWRLLSLFVQLTYSVFSLIGKQAYLPDLLKPQAFATRLKPFIYSNQMAKNLLGWKPNQFK